MSDDKIHQTIPDMAGTEPRPSRRYRGVVEYDFADSKCENCDEPTSEVFITDDDVELCRECWLDIPIERRFSLVGYHGTPPLSEASPSAQSAAQSKDSNNLRVAALPETPE